MSDQPGLFEFFKSIWQIISSRPKTPPSLEENQLLATILHRRSIRRFKQEKVPDDVFAAILEAGRLAPSTVNLQTWSFAVFTAATWRDRFYTQIPFKADRAVIILGDTCRVRLVLDAFPESPLVEYTIAVLNASLAAMNMNLAAEALGVGSVMLSETGRTGLLDSGYLKDKLALPDKVVPLMTIVFGYPDGPYPPPMPPKLPVEHLCFSQQYQKPDRRIMDTWMQQMKAGYKASFPFSSFDKQLNVYQSKIGQAESDLYRLIFGKEKY